MKTLEAKPFDQNAENWKQENWLFTSTVLEAGVTAYSSPRENVDLAHKFAREFVHHPRKWAPWCSFSRGAYPRICSTRENAHHADRLILNLTALSSSVPPEQLHKLRWSSASIFFVANHRHKPQWWRVQSDGIAAFHTKAWSIWLQLTQIRIVQS